MAKKQRRQLTPERKRLHKNTHNWSRIRYRKILRGKVGTGYEMSRMLHQ